MLVVKHRTYGGPTFPNAAFLRAMPTAGVPHITLAAFHATISATGCAMYIGTFGAAISARSVGLPPRWLTRHCGVCGAGRGHNVDTAPACCQPLFEHTNSTNVFFHRFHFCVWWTRHFHPPRQHYLLCVLQRAFLMLQRLFSPIGCNAWSCGVIRGNSSSPTLPYYRASTRACHPTAARARRNRYGRRAGRISVVLYACSRVDVAPATGAQTTLLAIPTNGL